MRRTCTNLKIIATFGGEPYRRSALRKPIIIRKKNIQGYKGGIVLLQTVDLMD
jgi:hypothetical protein